MKKTTRILIAFAIALAVMGIEGLISHFFGIEWGSGFLLLILLLAAVFVGDGLFIQKKQTVNVKKMELTAESVALYLKELGSSFDIDDLNDIRKQTKMADKPTSKQRSMLAELTTLEKNIRKYLTLSKNDMKLSERGWELLHQQIGTMMFYYRTLIVRCVLEGALLLCNDDSSSSDSDSSSSDNSSSDSSSSDFVDSSSSHGPIPVPVD